MDKKVDKQATSVRLEHLTYKGQPCIALRFPYETGLIVAAKSAGARWSATNKCWHTPNTPEQLRGIFAAFKGLAWVDSTSLFAAKTIATGSPPKPQAAKAQKVPAVPKAPPAQAHVEALAHMKRKLEIARYSPNSINTYLNATKQLFLHFPAKHPNDLRTEDIEAYQYHLASGKASNSYLNQVVNAVRYYYKDVLGDPTRVSFIERPRKERKLPTVLSEEEVTAILRSVDNLKHQCILMLIYSAGLRLGELINLQRTDIIPERKQVVIRSGKGRKDRITLLSVV